VRTHPSHDRETSPPPPPDAHTSRNRRGKLTLRGLVLARFWPDSSSGTQLAGARASPLAGVDAAGPGAELVMEDCVLHATVALDALRTASPYWDAAAAAGRLVRPVDGTPLGKQQSAGGQVALVDLAAAQQQAKRISGSSSDASLLLLDPARCYSGRGALIYDTRSLAAALTDPSVRSALIFHATALSAPTPGLQQLAAAPPLARRLVVSGCQGAALDFAGLRGVIAVGKGGELILQAPLLLTGSPKVTAAAAAAGAAGGDQSMLLSAVRVEGGGRLVLSGVQLVTQDAATATAQLPDGARTKQPGGVLVAAANLSSPDGGRIDLSSVVLREGPKRPPCWPDASAPVAAVSDLQQLRSALLDPALQRIELAADMQLAQQASAAGPWALDRSRISGSQQGPPSPLILDRSTSIRACSSDGRPLVFDFSDAVGAIVVVGGSTLQLSGDLLLRPCARGSPQCARVWPGLPAVVLGPGAQLQLKVRFWVGGPSFFGGGGRVRMFQESSKGMEALARQLPVQSLLHSQ